MQAKTSVATKIIGAVTLIVLGFILFSTIYNQIIAQNEGFFYMLIFGGILVLVFVLMSLITKLLAISTTAGASALLTILEIFVMLALTVLFVYQRLSFETSLPVEDSLFYRAASFITDGTLSGSLDVVTKLLRNPNDYAYAFILSIVFHFTSVLPEAVIYVNISLLIIIAFFAAHICHSIGGRVCGLVAFAATLFVPSQAYGVYTYNSVMFFTASLLIPLDIYIHIFFAEEMSTPKRVINIILLSFFTGLLLITEPVAILFVLLMVLHYLIYSRKHMRAFFIALGGILTVYLIFVIVKSSYLGVPPSEVFRYTGTRFRAGYNEDTGESYSFSQIYERLQEQIDNQNSNISDNYYFLTKSDGSVISAIQSSWLQLATSLIYMFTLVLSISCEIFMFRIRNIRGVPIMLMTIGTLFVAFIKSVSDAGGFYVFEILLLLGAVGLAYMYQNHHPEDFEEVEDIVSAMQGGQAEETGEPVVELTLEEQEEQLRRARALIFIGEDEELYEQIKKEEAEEKKRAALAAEEEKKHPKKVQTEEKTEAAADDDKDLAEDFSKKRKETPAKAAEDESDDFGDADVFGDDADFEDVSDFEEEDFAEFEDGEDIDDIEDTDTAEEPEDEDDFAGFDEFEEFEEENGLADEEEEADLEEPDDIDDMGDMDSDDMEEDEIDEEEPEDELYEEDSDEEPEESAPDLLDKKTRKRLQKEQKKAEKKAKKEAKKAAKKNKNTSNKEDTYEADSDEEDETEEEDFDGGSPKRGEPLKNPLPMPKKHESRPMDFDDEFEDEPEDIEDIDDMEDPEDFDEDF